MSSNNSNNSPELPGYMQTVYHWAYVKPENVQFLDRPLVVNTILWGNMTRLSRAAEAEVKCGQSVLQVATVYGKQIFDMAEAISPSGRYDLLDVTPIQVKRWQKKLEYLPHVAVYHADAENPPPTGQKYDVVLNFFLLHEVPDAKKRRIVKTMLETVAEGGKAVFVDYHEPVWWHPLKFFMRCVNRLLEPFAESLWDKPIKSFAGEEAENFEWKTETYFGGLYQKTVATKK